MKYNLIGFLKHNDAKKMTLASYYLAAKYRLLILCVKPKTLHKYWGEEGRESEPSDKMENYWYAAKVSRVVNRICNKTAWESKCLVRALVAQYFLKRKGIHSTLYLGCALKDGKMVAHAWIRVGEVYVTGGNGEGYSVVDMFYT